MAACRQSLDVADRLNSVAATRQVIDHDCDIEEPLELVGFNLNLSGFMAGNGFCSTPDPTNVTNANPSGPAGCYELTSTTSAVDWAAALDGVTLQYGISTLPNDAVAFQPRIGATAYTWPFSAGYNVGQTYTSNPHPSDGSQIQITYLQGPNGAAAPRATFNGSSILTVNQPGFLSFTTPIRFRIERVA